MSQPVLETRDLSGITSEGHKIKNINLELQSKETLVLIGENDSYQKAFISTISGTANNIKGDLLLNGNSIINTLKGNNLSEILFLFQTPCLIDKFTVAENLSYFNIPEKKNVPLINWKRINSKAKKIISELGLNFEYNTRVFNLSDEKKRFVEIARVLLNNPKVAIMYEPSESLSSKGISKFHKALDFYKEQGGSIIYITTKWEEALKIADKISVLKSDSVTKFLTAQEVKKNPKKLLNMLNNYSSNNSEEDGENTEFIEAIFEASKFLTSEHELKDVLLLLAKHITKIMNADSCIIDLIDKKTQSVIDEFEYKKNMNIKSELKKETILEIIKENEIYYSNKHNKDFLTLFENYENVKTLICIPVLIRSEIAGVIQIFYNNYYVHSEEETRYLSTFAQQAAIAIEETRLVGSSALLQESHHRIKNNLQAIISFIILQKKFIDLNEKEKINQILDDIIARIKSIAAIHDLLARKKDYNSILNINYLIEKVINYLNIDSRINFNLNLEDILIPYNKATSIAIVINEIVSNSLKHAFNEKSTGTIEIKCIRKNKYIYITIADNGIGIEEDFEIKNNKSLGLSIVKMIVEHEFKGDIDFVSDNGTRVKIKIPTKMIYTNKNKINTGGN